MRHETILLSVPEATAPAELIAYVPDNFPELGMDRRRPALIICPGGGYAFLSDREGEPVALRFAGLGYAAFVLRYHTAPQAHYPIPQRQLRRTSGGLRRPFVEPAGDRPAPGEKGGRLPP